ncbi:MAG: hypothetical protein U0X91_22765 [Spirosomataceae bacterium]
MFAQSKIQLFLLPLFALVALTTYADHDPAATGSESQRKTALALEAALNKSLSSAHVQEITGVLSPTQIPAADLSQEAKDAKALFDDLESRGKILPSLTNTILQSLPVAIPLDGTKQGYLALKKAVFYPTHVELEVYARLFLGEEELYFGNKKVNYVPASGFAGTVGLALLGTQEFANAQYKLSLTGGNAGTAPNAGMSQLKIDCGVFQALVLKGKFELNKDSFLKLDAKGYPMAEGTPIDCSVDFQTANLSDIRLPLKNSLAFTLKKSANVMGFLLETAFLDFSETATPASLNTLLDSFLSPKTDANRKQWTGFYAEKTRVYLPLFFYPATNKDPNPVRPAYESSALVMDASGIYMTSSQTAVAKWDKMGGSPMTVDEIRFTLRKSTYNSFHLKGKIGVLLAKSPFAAKGDKSYNFDNLKPEEYLKYTGSLDDKSENFAMKAETANSMYFMGAKSTLRDDSKVIFTQDSPTYRSAAITTTPDGNTTGTGTGLSEIPTESAKVTGDHTFYARLVTPKLSFRFVIGKDLAGNTVNHNAASSNTDKIVSLGIILAEDVVLGYSFLSKKPIFSFSRIGYQQMGQIPVFGYVGLRKLMVSYDDQEKMATLEVEAYANFNPKSRQDALGPTPAATPPPTKSTIQISLGFNLTFAMEVSDEKTEASFDGFELTSLRINNASTNGFTIDGSLRYVTDDEDYGTAVMGDLMAEIETKSLKAASDKPLPRFQINWIAGKKDGYRYGYFDGMFDMGAAAGIPVGAIKINGLGVGVAVNMYQTKEFGSRKTATGLKFLPREKVYGAMVSFSFISNSEETRGYVGIYFEFATDGDGFRKLTLYGQVEFAKDASPLAEFNVKDVLKKTAGSLPTTSGTSNTTPVAKTQANGTLYNKQVFDAIKMLDVPLDDKFALFKFNFMLDNSEEEFHAEGNFYGFMHVNLNETSDSDGSYIRGAADDEGLGFLGMISFRAQKEKGYFWIGRPDQPLAIEAMINVGTKPDSPTYIRFGATFFMVGGNIGLPSTKVKYYSLLENAKDRINSELRDRGNDEVHFDLPPSFQMDGNRYFAMGFSLGGSVELSNSSAKIFPYFQASIGFGMMLSYSQVPTCNNANFLGSAIFHGSGELGLSINLSAKGKTRFAILKGAFSVGGVGDGKKSYGAGIFEYSILGGIVEGKAFFKVGSAPCLDPRQYNLSSNVNLVTDVSPHANIQSANSSGSANFTEGEVYLNEMIILKINPEIAVYERCNIVVDGRDTLVNVAVVANYSLSPINNIQRWKEKRKERQDDEIRFVGLDKAYNKVKRRGPNSTLWWGANLHVPNQQNTLKVTLLITDDANIQFGDGTRKWDKLGDFEQNFEFRFRTGVSLKTEHVQKNHDYYIRNP